MAALRGLQGAAWDYLIDILDIERLEEEDELRLYLLLIFQDLHAGQLEAVDHLAKDLEDSAQPWVVLREDKALGALFDDIAGERDDQPSILVLEALNEQLLDVELIAADRTIPAQGELAQELAESFQVLLDLADHAGGAANLVGDLVELSFIDE